MLIDKTSNLLLMSTFSSFVAFCFKRNANQLPCKDSGTILQMAGGKWQVSENHFGLINKAFGPLLFYSWQGVEDSPEGDTVCECTICVCQDVNREALYHILRQ